jgi:Tfp pilus assembly protein PilO
MERIYSWLAKAPFTHKFLLTVFVSGAMVAYYFMNTYTVAKTEIEESRKKAEYGVYAIQEAQRNLENAKKSQAEMDEMAFKGEELTKRIPVSVDLSELVGELDQMADDIRISSIIPQEDDATSFDSVVVRPIKFILQGRFHSICRFLYKMFQMNRLMDVGDVVMRLRAAPQGGTNERNLLEAEFTARIYYSPSFIPARPAADKNKPDLLQGGANRMTMGPETPVGP